MYRKGWLKGTDRVFISVKDEAKYLNKIIRIIGEWECVA